MERTVSRLASLVAAVRFAPPRAVLVLCAAVWGALLGLVALGSYGGDPRAFICLGEKQAHPAAFAGIPRTSEHGYDGQFYAALALDPLLRQAETVPALDAPLYRASRIGVPLAAWALAYGHPTVAVVFYQLLCWAGGLLALCLAARWLASERRPTAWAVLLAFSAGLATSMFRSTPDAAAVALILAALWWQRDERWGATVAALAAATMVRETSFLAAMAISFVEMRRRRWRPAIAALAGPLLAFAGWQLYLHLLLPATTTDRGIGALGVPFAWLPRKLSRLAETGFAAGRMEVLGLLALVACAAALVLLLARFPRWTAPEATFAAFGLLALSLGYPVYVEVYAHTRVLLVLPFLAVLAGAGQPRRGGRWAFAAVPITLALTGITVIRGEIGLGTVRSALSYVAGGSARVLPAGGPPAALPAAVEPAPTPAPTPVPTPTPMPALQPLYVLPVARAAGHYGAQWRTELALENSASTAAGVGLELFLTGKPGAQPRRAALTLEPGEKRVLADALGELFGTDGSGALRVVRESQAVTVRARTYDSAATAPRGPYLDAVEEGAAFVAGRTALLSGLGHDPAGRSRTRTNLGLLNVAAVALEVEVVVLDPDGARLGSQRLQLGPREFRQVNDLFGAIGVSSPAAGSARVTSSTSGGAFLAYASVVRRDPSSATYVLPKPGRGRPARSADGPGAPAATPAPPSSSTGSPAGVSAPTSPH
jgi:hypothetical protein